MKLKMWLAMVPLAAVLAGGLVFLSQSGEVVAEDRAANDLPVVTVYKSATCGCCKAWVQHLEDNGDG
ncbi:MAG: hypothetical protein R3E95_13760 [Thiolinea sp.]